jgi:hypothetical protein
MSEEVHEIIVKSFNKTFKASLHDKNVDVEAYSTQ